MKNAIRILAIISSFILFNCSKSNSQSDTIASFPDERPLEIFYATANFTVISSTSSTNPNYEVGTTFKPLEYGIIKSFTIRLPANPSRTKITLWDKNSGTIVTTLTVPLDLSYIANTEVVLPLATPLALTKNKEYILSMNSSTFYSRTIVGVPEVDFPYTAGSFQIINCRYSLTSNQIMPQTIILGIVYGDLGVVFQRLQ